MAERAAYVSAWGRFFDDYDVLLTPTMQLTAFEVGKLTPDAIDGHPVRSLLRRLVQLLPAREPDGHAGDLGAVRLRYGRPADRPAGDGRRGADALTLHVAEAWERLFALNRRAAAPARRTR